MRCEEPERRRKCGFAVGDGVGKVIRVTTQAKALTKQALALKPEERIALAETLLTSVDRFASEEVHRKARAVVHEAARLSSRR